MQTVRRNILKAALAGAALPLLPTQLAQAAEAKPGSRLMGKAKFITVDGTRTRYFDGGKGEPMVLIHGGQWPATTSADGWDAIFDRLAARHHVYAFDKLGMGYTDNPKTDADYSMDAIVRHAYGFIKAVGITRAVVLGHSRGALPAARIAVDHPELVSHLVILDTNALSSDDIKLSDRQDPPVRDTPPTRDEIRKAALASPLYYKKDFVTDAFVEAEYKIGAQPRTHEADRKFAELRDKWIRDNPEKAKANPLMANNAGSAVWWMVDCKHETLDRIKAGKLKAPTVLIWGWNDPFAPYVLGLDTMGIIAKVVDRTEMHFVNHASHLVHVDQPEQVAHLALDFIHRKA